MDIISASNIGMTNAYKDKKKRAKKATIKDNKLYVLAEIKYMIDGVVGHNNIIIQICNEAKLLEMAREYYRERNLRSNKKWEEINIDKIKPMEAIQILTKRKYTVIQEINQDIIGRMLTDKEIVLLISVEDYNWQNKGV